MASFTITQNPSTPAPTRTRYGLSAGGGVGSMKPGRRVSYVSRTPAATSSPASASADLAASLQQQQQRQNRQAQRRYRNLLRTQRRTERKARKQQRKAEKALKGQGDVAKERIGRSEEQAQASATQNLISRGLGNTTIQDTVRRGISDDAELQMQGVDEMVGRNLASVYQGQAGQAESLGRLGIDTQLSRQDVSPNMSPYLQMIQQLASLSV